ncbi:serine/threonine protein kinase [Cyanobacterium aponinum FACHB-4101]|uniref:serine/threonine protein kinase n=1 Tax=Cyanobacterium aponinum TaxID=379064 RepID=UPI0016809425|nr:serine/threonine-protein kinase [Cyanobacterium aponinum]MBD2394050.1 serine/threonine protein kinase [Cyanobacterium aponinum FACHB-4101]
MDNPAAQLPIIPFPYQVIKKLGNGSFGKVYLVINTTNQQQCVIKQLHPSSEQPNFIKQARRLFRQEAEILKKLNHPQIPKLIDYFEDKGEFYLVEEYIEGKTLRHELPSGKCWTEVATIKLLLEGLGILKDIHNLGIIHRDIKPDNFIRRQEDQKLVLIDFGAVKEFNLEQSRLLDPTIAMGTRGYMPTEQARGKPRKNSDIYALGVIAIQALTGKNPLELEEDEEGEILWRNLATVDDKLGEIITKMTRYQHKLRYQSADDVIKDLHAYIYAKQQSCPPTQILEEKNKPSSIEDNYSNTSTSKINSISSPINQSLKNQEDTSEKFSFSDWLKSPFGSTLTTALTIGVIATGGVYVMNQQQKAQIEKEKADFLTSLDTAYNNQNYLECFEKAEERLQDENNHISAQELGEYIGKCRLEEAKQKAQFLNYAEAVATAKQIPTQNQYHNQAQIMMEDWSRAIFDKAKHLYTEEGKLEDALKEIDTIPDNPVRQAGLIVVSQWQEEYRTNSYLINQAQKDLEYGNCQSAIETVSKIEGSNYWLLEGKKIVDQAEKCFQDQGIESNINTNNSTDNSSNNQDNQNNQELPDNVIICPPILCPE